MQNDIENILNEIASKEFERTDGIFSLCGLNCGLCGY